jgi:Enoyl-(Acyl carrier protein) reductase
MPLSSIVPLGRLGTPEEIAKVVVFLPSDDRSYVTANGVVRGGRFRTSVGGVHRSLWHGAGELDRGDVQGSGPNGDHDARG